MKLLTKALFFLILTILISNCQNNLKRDSFQSYWGLLPDRPWIGPEFWANRLQDWQLKNGRVECINSELPKRTLHVLTRYLSSRPGSFELKVTTGQNSPTPAGAKQGYTGFLFGTGTEKMDYRRRALIHGAYGKGGGIIAAISNQAEIQLIDNETGLVWISSKPDLLPGQHLPEAFEFSVKLVPKGKNYNIILSARNPSSNEEIVKLDTLLSKEGNFGGGIALISNSYSSWFDNLQISGSKVRVDESYKFGPVIGTQYTLSDKILKITAQLAPISESDAQTVALQIRDAGSGQWNTIASSQIKIPGYTAGFRLVNWQDEVRYDYRIAYKLTDNKGVQTTHYYSGVIVQDPGDREQLTIAAFTGNSNSHGSINGQTFNFTERLWFPHEDLTSNVAKHNPDLLVYTGDNVYEGRPTPADFSSIKNTGLDYLYKWYLFLWAHGDLTRNIPAITIPDDHDVYHGNLWGASGKIAPDKPIDGIYPNYYKGFENHWQQDQGGYKLDAELVNMIQYSQVSHLPDPYDPATVKQGIGVYFCNLNYGRISWAVLEDRKFKSAPGNILPNDQIINGFSQKKGLEGKRLDSPEASLLGERQLKFLRHWSADWKGIDMKVAISQSIFANISTYPDTFLTDSQTPRLGVLPWGEIPKDFSKAKDMDSNGWPQTGRNKALDELRKGFALMIGGDQHLGSVAHHGIDEWEDAGYSFCVPSIANLWPRRWFPPEAGENHQEGMPLYTGRYFDGFGNRVTVLAVSNPYQSNKEPTELHDRAPGYGIVKLNKKTQDITLECWPRHCDPEAYDASQYPGWPVTFNMYDNYGRKAIAWLSPLNVSGLERSPVVQVVNEITGEIIYTLRIKGNQYQPKVFKDGTYTIHIGEPGTSRMKSLSGLIPGNQDSQEKVLISFE